MKRRILSVLLALVMLLGLMPTAALAAPVEESPSGGEIAVDPADEAVPVAASLEGDAPATLFAVSASSVQPKIVLAGPNDCRYHHGDNWDNGFGKDNDGAGRGSYDGGTVTATNSGASASIYLKERDHLKNADYMLQPFTLSVEVPAYTTYAVEFKLDLSVNRNANGASWYFIEMANNTQDAAYTKNISTKNAAGDRLADSEFRACGDGKTYTPSGTLKPISFANTTGSTKTVSLPYALVVGNSKSTSLLTSYHHQLETRMTLTTQSVTAYMTIQYDPNGGSGEKSIVTSANSVQLKSAPTRTGYTFTGWKDNVTGEVYAAGAAYTGNQGLDLVAQWEQNKYTVTFNANGGNAVSPAPWAITSK